MPELRDLGLNSKANARIDAFMVADSAFRKGDPLSDEDLKVLREVYLEQFHIVRAMSDKNRPYEMYLINAFNSIDSFINARKRHK